MSDVEKNFYYEKIDIKNAQESEYDELAALIQAIRKERLPDDPLRSRDSLVMQWKNLPPFVDLEIWLARDGEGGKLVGHGGFVTMNTGQNEHLCQLSIDVIPEYRRQGIGTTLMGKAVDYARRTNRRLLLTNTNGNVPAGSAFIQHFNGQAGLAAHSNQLALADVDRDMLHAWQARAKERATKFKLELWEGAYPEEHMDRVVLLHEVMDSQPLDDLEVEDMKFSAEQIRGLEKTMLSSGVMRWTMVAIDTENGQFVGFTELMQRPESQMILSQGNTGVFPEYRGFGLGRWLKAAMLQKVLDELPDAQFVRTENADSNAPMLKINNELGFKPYMSETVWQVEVEKVAEVLAA